MVRLVFAEAEYRGVWFLVEQPAAPDTPREGLTVYADNASPSALKYKDDLGNVRTVPYSANVVLRDGAQTLTADWDIGDGRMLQADKVRARDGDGLSLFEDGGLGIFIRDGGHVEIAGAILADGTRQALTVTGTLPASPSASVTGVLFDVTSAGSAAQVQYGLRANLNAGFTGNHLSAAMVAINDASGVGANLVKSGTPLGNAGFAFTATGVTTGYNYGGTGFARYGNVSIGGFFRSGYTTSFNDKNGATYIGVGGIARNNTASGSKSIGGYFGLDQADPAFESAALIADNADAAYPIFLGRDNGSTVFIVADGGDVGVMTVSPTAALDVNSDVLRLRTSKTPASASAAGNTGDRCWDSNYLYQCVATNTWKRAALSTW